MKRTSDKEALQRAENLLADGNQEKWEQGLLGRDILHTKIAEESGAFNRKKSKSFKLTSIRLDVEMVDELTKFASELGMGYQTYIRMILSKHLNEKRDSD